MDPFKELMVFNFDYILRIHHLIVHAIDKEKSLYLKKVYSKELDANGHQDFMFYHQSTNILIQSTFLQLYSELEETLYHESGKETIGQSSSIRRFEKALTKQGYDTSGNSWTVLVNIAKIRNCLLHSNGRLDIDRCRKDTESAIEIINNSAGHKVLEIIKLKGHKLGTDKIILLESFLEYYSFIIKRFINLQS